MGSYECLICFSGIRTRDPTWSCRKCYKVLHLKCAKQWGRRGTGGFRCPHCSEVYKEVPTRYLCFCGKVREPTDDGYSTPHSCGDPCGRTRGVGCPHPCPEHCHPGPCPPCTQDGPVRSCFCGAEKVQLKCGEPFEGRSCGKVCGRALNCGQHTCPLECHDGPCEPCAETFTQRCFCGKVVEPTRVCDGAEAHFVDGTPATFRCFEKCGKTKDCGEHKCTLPCHLGDCPPCELKPEVCTTCPCGKKPLRILSKKVRTQCTDPVACCTSQCGKFESCQKHGCQLKCHEGECGPCKAQVSAQCGCKGTTVRIACHKVPKDDDGVPGPTVKEERTEPWPPRCTKRCGIMKSCGRHRCNDVCCRNRDGHICHEICTRKLECGAHTCGEPCHPGACKPCGHLVLEDLTCACGKQVLEPPQPCGTEPPECTEPCRKELPCGHAAVAHKCHFGDCPLCAVRVEKKCAGGHTTVTAPCHVQFPTCHAECGKELPCGRHKCKKKCHAGPCPTVKEGTDTCGAPCHAKLACEHLCQKTCHGPSVSCTEKCTVPTEVHCACGRITNKMPCHQYYTAMRSLSGKKGGRGMVAPTVPCTDDCSHASRLDGMRAALGIDKDREEGAAFQNIGVLSPLKNVVYTHSLWLASAQNLHHVKAIERTFEDFLRGSFNTHMMQPMGDDKRKVVHELGPFYNIGVETLDRPPNASCKLTRLPNARVPTPLLSEWRQDPNELAHERATEDPESVIMFQEITTVDKYKEVLKALRPFIGRWIGIKKSATCYMVSFMDATDCQVCLSHLKRDRFPIKHSTLAEYNAGETPAAMQGVRVVQGGGRRRAEGSSSQPSGPPPATAAPAAGVWAAAAARRGPAPSARPVDPTPATSSTRWEGLKRK